MVNLKKIAAFSLILLISGCANEETRDRLLIGAACVYAGANLGYAIGQRPPVATVERYTQPGWCCGERVITTKTVRNNY